MPAYLMNDLADPNVIQLAFLFPFLPMIAIGITTFILGYIEENDDDDDDDRGTLQPAWNGM
jgi:hypothetical protein